MINRNVAHLDKTLFLLQLTESRYSSWEILGMCNYYSRWSDRCHLLIMFSYWHTNNPPNDCDGGKKSIFRLAAHQRDIRAIPKNDSYQRTHKHGCSLNGTLRNIVEGDISIAWPLAGHSPSLPFRIYTLINLSKIKKPTISLFKWISSFCGILRLIEGSVLCGIHQDNCRPMQHCSRLHVYLLQSP